MVEGKPSPFRPTPRQLLEAGAFAVGYALLGWLSYRARLPPVGLPAFWLSNGLAVGVLVRARPSRWPLLLLGLLLADATTTIEHEFQAPAVAIWAAADLVQCAVGAWLIRMTVGSSTTLSRLRDVVAFTLIVLLIGPIASAWIAGLAILWIPEASFVDVAVGWWSTGGLGTFAVGSLVLTWTAPLQARPTLGQAIGTIGAVVLLAAVFRLVFGLQDPALLLILLAFTTFPFLSFVALRFGPRGASTAAVALGAVAIWQTLEGAGPFADIGSRRIGIFAVQVFFALASLSALILAAAAEERRRDERGRRLLLDTAMELGETTELRERLVNLAHRLVPSLARGCAIGLVDGTSSEPVAISAQNELIEERLRQRLGNLDAGERLDDGEAPLVLFPLRGPEGALGTMVLAPNPGGLDPDERRLAEAVAQRAAAALETERLRSSAVEHERSVEKSLALLDTLIGNAPVGLAFLDRELRFLRINHALAAINGLLRESHIGKTLREVSPFVADQVEPQLRKALETGVPVTGVEVTGTRRRHAGEPGFWLCSYFPIRIREGAPLGVGVVVVDLTERKREERALALSEARFRSLAEATAEIVWTADSDGRIRHDSPSWRAYTGQSLKQWMGLGWLEAVHPEDRTTALSTWRKAVDGATPYSSEYRVRRADGVYRYHESRGAAVLDDAGNVREWVGMNFDINARKEAEAERARLFREAQEAIRVRDDFLSIASHELKTPLTPLSTWLQVMDCKIRAGENIDERIVGKARTSLDRLTTLINDLLDAARIQARRLALQLEPTSLSEVVRSQVSSMSGASPRHELLLVEPEKEIWVMAEHSRLEQVVVNLLENAIKYSPNGGTIRISVGTEGDEATFSISDPGIGIPREQQRWLFDRFFRARNVSASSYGGLGLGLYIVRDILEHHGGRIWVESEPGEGSTFSVALPLLTTRERSADANTSDSLREVSSHT